MEQKPWPPPDLPTDLLPGILSKLPVKSLLRFRSVSKTWRCIIHDPKFIKSYKHRPESQIFVLHSKSEKLEYAVRCSKTFRVIADHCFPSEFRNLSAVIGGNDGMLFFESMGTRKTHLVLWNPSIRRVRILPDTPQEVEVRRGVSVGIGFDPRIEDYKYVRFGTGHYCYDKTDWVSVYTLRTSSWKTIQFKTKGDMPWCIRWFDSGCHSVCFRGVLFSIALTLDLAETTIWNEKLHVVSFDLNTEEFSSAKLPKFRYVDQWLLKCANDDSRLALIGTRRNEGWIWWAQGEGGDVTWSNVYKFSSTFPVDRAWYIDLNISRNGGDGGDEVAMVILLRSEAAVILYNVQFQEQKILLETQNSSPFIPDYDVVVPTIPYVESLVLLY